MLNCEHFSKKVRGGPSILVGVTSRVVINGQLWAGGRHGGVLGEVRARCGILFLFPFLLTFLQKWNRSPTLCFAVSHCGTFPVRR